MRPFMNWHELALFSLATAKAVKTGTSTVGRVRPTVDVLSKLATDVIEIRAGQRGRQAVNRQGTG